MAVSSSFAHGFVDYRRFNDAVHPAREMGVVPVLTSKILSMPIGTAEVERSFSTMNRILRSDRCRLLPEHVDILMKISIEGP